ncbi:Vang-like protein [Trinorchestia longiramus]|nr:Vang-like protein [Trinorchestia longiramus]
MQLRKRMSAKLGMVSRLSACRERDPYACVWSSAGIPLGPDPSPLIPLSSGSTHHFQHSWSTHHQPAFIPHQFTDESSATRTSSLPGAFRRRPSNYRNTTLLASPNSRRHTSRRALCQRTSQLRDYRACSHSSSADTNRLSPLTISAPSKKDTLASRRICTASRSDKTRRNKAPTANLTKLNGVDARVATLRNYRVSSMSYSISGQHVSAAPSYVGAWTPEQESVVSGFTDASIYASLQRQPNHRHHQKQHYQPVAQQPHSAQQQQHTYQRLQHPRAKPTYVALRGVNASRSSTLQRPQRRYSEMTAGAGGEGGLGGGEMIEVQIIPQDDNWGDNTTAITGNTSVRSESFQDLAVLSRDSDNTATFVCQRYAGSAVCAFVALFAFISPILMVLVPRLPVLELKRDQLQCDAECDGLLISFSFKLLILLLASWAVFFRQPKATMPRIFIYRALISLLVFVFTFSYWLFYIVRVLEDLEQVQYRSVVQFSLSLVDALLFIQYLAVVLLELRHLSPQYCIKVLRSPDGHSCWYNIGQLSVQRAAAWVLERYYQDFPIYNPYLDRVPMRKKTNNHNSSSFKYYDVDGSATGAEGQTRAVLTANARRRDSAHNERFYEEHEYERRVRKRRARLLTAAEEAFTHIKRMHDEHGPTSPMNPQEAAQSIFPGLARALQKYLRVTRQQPRHSMESILNHLALCLQHDMSPRAFLEKYLEPTPILQNDQEHRGVQSWGLVCEQLLSRPIKAGTVFQLRQNDVSLLCCVQPLPHYNINEEIIHPKSNKFVLRLNSETSV